MVSVRPAAANSATPNAARILIMTRLSGIIDAAGKGQAFRGIRIVDDDKTGTR